MITNTVAVVIQYRLFLLPDLALWVVLNCGLFILSIAVVATVGLVVSSMDVAIVVGLVVISSFTVVVVLVSLSSSEEEFVAGVTVVFASFIMTTKSIVLLVPIILHV